MNSKMQKKLSRRQFAGAMAAAVAAPALLASPLAAQEKKQAEPEKKVAAQAGSEEEKALKQLREFSVPEGAEPALAFRADWGK